MICEVSLAGQPPNALWVEAESGHSLLTLIILAGHDAHVSHICEADDLQPGLVDFDTLTTAGTTRLLDYLDNLKEPGNE